MADVEFKIDSKKLWQLVCADESTMSLVGTEAKKVENRANSMSAGFRTEWYYKDHKAPPTKGNTQPSYKTKVGKPRGIVPIAIVYTGNYSAMKDNYQHNTLLKSL